MATVYDINIKKLDEKAVIPTYGSEYAAGRICMRVLMRRLL